MKLSRSAFTPLVLAVLLIAGYGEPARAQCAVTSTNSSPGPPIFIVKSIYNASMCTLTMFNNADCHPGGNYPPALGAMLSGAGMLPLSATRYMAGIASCGWTCNCGQVVTDGSDGLPVELMEFEIGDSGDPAVSDDKAAAGR